MKVLWSKIKLSLAPTRVKILSITGISADFAGRAEVYKVNVDEEGSLAAKFGIMSIPTLIIFKDGEIFDKVVGVVPKDAIAAKIENALK